MQSGGGRGRSWDIRADDEAGGRLSPLWHVESLQGAYRLTTERETCGGEPVAATPARLRGYRVLSLQPPRAESCDGWFAVDLYLAPGAGERVHGVLLRR